MRVHVATPYCCSLRAPFPVCMPLNEARPAGWRLRGRRSDAPLPPRMMPARTADPLNHLTLALLLMCAATTARRARQSDLAVQTVANDIAQIGAHSLPTRSVPPPVSPLTLLGVFYPSQLACRSVGGAQGKGRNFGEFTGYDSPSMQTESVRHPPAHPITWHPLSPSPPP